ncbi:MAG: hypothetical protein IJN64_15655 [Lachnospiraceae bacterium]|nr:hypothetical protein [Lachnospiraceae bacterium]
MQKRIVSVLFMVIGVLVGTIIGGGIVGKKISEVTEKMRKLSDKHFALFMMMNRWVKIKQDGKCLESYFIQNGYKNIAVYGMSYVGETLLNELYNSEVKIMYGIDKNTYEICSDINIVLPEDVTDEVDAIIVTAISFFDEIKENLRDSISCPILSLEDILYEI